jgi:dynamin 1-like protein
VVKKNVADLVPKTVMAFLVSESKATAQRELVSQIYKESNLDELLVEDPMVAQNRENCQKIVGALRQAQKLISEVT